MTASVNGDGSVSLVEGSTDWVFVDGPFDTVAFDDAAETLLPYVTPGTIGPPERVSFEGNEVSDDPGAGVLDHGDAAATYLPWNAGRLYHDHGYEEHRNVVLDLVDHTAGNPSAMTTNAPRQVAVYPAALDDGTYLLQYLNRSGFDGVAYGEPVPIHDVRVSIEGVDPVAATPLADGWSASFEGDEVVLDRLGAYAAVTVDT